jgi:hypothetical protein
MKRFSKIPQSSAANTRLEKKLMKYALAGGALLGAPFASQAGIIYSGVVNDQVAANSGFTVDFPGGALFTLNASNASYMGDWGNAVRVNATGASFMVSGGGAAALVFGSLITSGTSVNGAGLINYGAAGFKGGNWPQNGSSAYLGLTFSNAGQQFKGWADISTTVAGAQGTESADLISYAYTDAPGESITAGETDLASGAPEPSSLALFALGGSAALALLRRRRAAARLN